MTLGTRGGNVAVLGAGIIGISVAYHLALYHGVNRVTLIDSGDPMGLTSANPARMTGIAGPNVPDVVLRGARRLSPALAGYIGHLPWGAIHYGGYDATTPENWPLIGPMRTPGAFMAGALSGFGTMAATATEVL